MEIRDIFEFEKKYRKLLEEIEEWAYLRIPVGFYLKNKGNQENDNKDDENEKKFIRKKIPHILYIFELFKNIFYGFRNWFDRYDYIFFSDSAERRVIDDKYFDKFADDIIRKLYPSKVLLIEKPNPTHFKIDTVYTKYIVSHTFIQIFAKLFSILFGFRPVNGKIQKLQKIINNHNININLVKYLGTYKSYKHIYKLLLRIYKPKAIFINCHYCYQGLIEAAKELNIKVIEVQHGVINKHHFGYNSYIKLKLDIFPDILLSFGKKVETNLIKKIYPIGSFYLEYVRKNFQVNDKLNFLLKKYEHIVGISMQDQEWERKAIFDFFIPLAYKKKDILFIVIPRKSKSFPQLPSNMLVYDKLDCHNTIMHCCVHSTLYSTCALEAPSLGVPNILINSSNFAKIYYEGILSKKTTIIVNTHDEFLNALNYLVGLGKNDIIKANKDIFIMNYEDNIKKFINEELKK